MLLYHSLLFLYSFVVVIQEDLLVVDVISLYVWILIHSCIVYISFAD